MAIPWGDYRKPYIDEPKKIVIDATCYKSEVRFPTNVKLLWESLEYVVSLERDLDKSLIRSKYLAELDQYTHRLNHKQKTKLEIIKKAR